MLDQAWEWTLWWEECHKVHMLKCNLGSNLISQDNLLHLPSSRFKSTELSKLGNNSNKKPVLWLNKELTSNLVRTSNPPRPKPNSNSTSSRWNNSKLWWDSNSNFSKCKLLNTNSINKFLKTKLNSLLQIMPIIKRRGKKGTQIKRVIKREIRKHKLIPIRELGSKLWVSLTPYKECLLKEINSLDTQETSLLIRRIKTLLLNWWHNSPIPKSLLNSRIRRKLVVRKLKTPFHRRIQSQELWSRQTRKVRKTRRWLSKPNHNEAEKELKIRKSLKLFLERLLLRLKIEVLVWKSQLKFLNPIWLRTNSLHRPRGSGRVERKKSLVLKELSLLLKLQQRSLVRKLKEDKR